MQPARCSLEHGGGREACASGASREPRRREITSHLSHSHDSRAHSVLLLYHCFTRPSEISRPKIVTVHLNLCQFQSTRVCCVVCVVSRERTLRDSHMQSPVQSERESPSQCTAECRQCISDLSHVSVVTDLEWLVWCLQTSKSMQLHQK